MHRFVQRLVQAQAPHRDTQEAVPLPEVRVLRLICPSAFTEMILLSATEEGETVETEGPEETSTVGKAATHECNRWQRDSLFSLITGTRRTTTGASMRTTTGPGTASTPESTGRLTLILKQGRLLIKLTRLLDCIPKGRNVFGRSEKFPTRGH